MPLWSSAVLGLGLGGLLVYYTLVLPDPLQLRQKERSPVIRILARDGEVLAERGQAHDYMPLDLLPRHVIDAVVAIEDRRFFEHWGLDLTGTARAMLTNLRAGHFAQGGSTLTQQLAKNLFLSPDRTLTRKIEELMLAIWLETRLTKTDILELYLNRVYFGGGAYGIEAAAQRYFDKSARELSIAEAAIVAGLLKAPSKYAPTASPGLARGRGRMVVAKMREAGSLSPAQEAKARRERIRFADFKPVRDASGIEYVVDVVLERLPPLLGSGHAEVVVETTIDAALQKRLQSTVGGYLASYGAAAEAGQAAAVVLDLDGGIRALVGGRSYAESQFNRASKARRQPGSAFKPFVYLAALEAGMGPESIAYDLPLTVDGWTPRNDSGRHDGAMSLSDALARSINTIAVRLLLDVGAARVVDTAERLGIRADPRAGPALALGASEVTLVELAGAYVPFANGGGNITPHTIRRVRSSSGRILFARDATRATQVVAPEHAGMMSRMLRRAVATGTGKRAQIARHEVAGKTGTTTDFRDAWFVGYTSHLVAGVWVGNDTGKPMSRVTGGSLPADIWREAMTAAHEGRAPLPLPGGADARSAPPPATVELLPWRPRTPLAPPASVPAGRRAAPGADVDGVASTAPASAVTARASSSGSGGAGLRQSQAPKAGVKAPLPQLPSERIGADFFARALADPPASDAGVASASPARSAPRPLAAQASIAGSSVPKVSGFDVNDVRARLEGRPAHPGPSDAAAMRPRHPGMMSLGTRRAFEVDHAREGGP